MNPEIDAYIAASEKWPKELSTTRSLLLDCGLTEEIKWGKPCYLHEGTNILILQEMKDFLALMFFKGALLDDPAGVLEAQGPNTRAARRICVRSAAEADRLSGFLPAYVANAIDVEEAGLELGPAPEVEFVVELQQRLDRDAELKAAFSALTPGRQREYNLHISDAKQAKTREARVEKFVPKILAGKGFRDR